MSFEEFRAVLCDWSYIDVSDHSVKLLRDVREIIKNNNYDIKNLFHTYERDHG